MCEIHTRHAALQVLCHQVVKALTLFSAQHIAMVSGQNWWFTGSTSRMCSGLFRTMAHGENSQVRGKSSLFLYPFLLPNYIQFIVLMKSNCKDKFISPVFFFFCLFFVLFLFFGTGSLTGLKFAKQASRPQESASSLPPQPWDYRCLVVVMSAVNPDSGPSSLTEQSRQPPPSCTLHECSHMPTLSPSPTLYYRDPGYGTLVTNFSRVHSCILPSMLLVFGQHIKGSIVAALCSDSRA